MSRRAKVEQCVPDTPISPLELGITPTELELAEENGMTLEELYKAKNWRTTNMSKRDEFEEQLRMYYNATPETWEKLKKLEAEKWKPKGQPTKPPSSYAPNERAAGRLTATVYHCPERGVFAKPEPETVTIAPSSERDTTAGNVRRRYV